MNEFQSYPPSNQLGCAPTMLAVGLVLVAVVLGLIVGVAMSTGPGWNTEPVRVRSAK